MFQRWASQYVCNNYSRDGSVTRMVNNLGWHSLQHVVQVHTWHSSIGHQPPPHTLCETLLANVSWCFSASISHYTIHPVQLPTPWANWNNLAFDAVTEDLQLAILTHTASFPLSTFPMLKLHLQSYKTLACTHTHTHGHACTYTESVSF